MKIVHNRDGKRWLSHELDMRESDGTLCVEGAVIPNMGGLLYIGAYDFCLNKQEVRTLVKCLQYWISHGTLPDDLDFEDENISARDLVASLFWSWRRMGKWLGWDSWQAKDFEMSFYMARTKLIQMQNRMFGDYDMGEI